jgi:phosphoglycerate dehydrogenase-like enzyme
MRPLHTEPLRSDHPLGTIDNVTLPAHADFRTLEASMTLLRRAIGLTKITLNLLRRVLDVNLLTM